MSIPADVVAARASTPVQRAHLYLPVFDDDNQIVKEISVTLLADDGSTLTPEAWSGPLADFDQPVTWPIAFSGGVVDLWLTVPGRFNLLAENKNRAFSRLYSGVDVRNGSDLQMLADAALDVTGLPESGSWLQVAADGTAHWVTPPLIPPHNHSGTQPGSTILNDASETDANADQTWLGYQAGENATGSDTTVLGAGAPAMQSVLAGNGTSAASRGAVVLGTGSSTVSQGAVALGDSLAAASGTELVIEEDSTGSASFSLTSFTVMLRPAFAVTASTMVLGSSMVATPPAGASNPVLMQYDQVLVPGTVRVSGQSQLGGASNVLAFFEATGAVKTTIDPTTATGALGSLLAALRAYNLV